MNLTNLDLKSIQALRADLEIAIKAVAQKHGVSIKTGHCRFSSEAATMKIEIATIATNGEIVDVEMSALKANLRYLGLSEDFLGKTFSLGGRTFKLAGYKRARYAKPMLLRCTEDNKTYVAPLGQVRTALGLTAGFSYV